MSSLRSSLLPPEIARYVTEHSTPPDAAQRRLIERTAAETGAFAGMQIGSDQGVLLEILTRAVDARLAVEIGTFTGYSSISIARGLADGGRLHCFDLSDEWTSIARAAWQDAGVADRIELHLGPALEYLEPTVGEGPVDFAFVDADKGGYLSYVEFLIPRLRPGGLLCLDNTLWSGAVIDPSRDDDDTRAIRAVNDALVADDRLRVSLVPIGDGLTVCQRR
jgi:caffeoyl-CoA O-methyltransferase